MVESPNSSLKLIPFTDRSLSKGWQTQKKNRPSKTGRTVLQLNNQPKNQLTKLFQNFGAVFPSLPSSSGTHYGVLKQLLLISSNQPDD
ncbi:hypothetical protein D3A96_00785 [Robertkochia marina]|nr:hypothetical protein D3A96_00785 [Robertkochia marina]